MKQLLFLHKHFLAKYHQSEVKWIELDLKWTKID